MRTLAMQAERMSGYERRQRSSAALAEAVTKATEAESAACEAARTATAVARTAAAAEALAAAARAAPAAAKPRADEHPAPALSRTRATVSVKSARSDAEEHELVRLPPATPSPPQSPPGSFAGPSRLA
mmetsp:Transcript_943/g.3559  ORF Transcript_943/g.3559 Transcript_943/m.3559 type:complete len:128 (+) Transcript_943:1384-1767(+)